MQHYRRKVILLDRLFPLKISLLCCFLFCLFIFQPRIGETANLPQKIIGTHYTGSTWAPAAWSNLNKHEVATDLEEIKSNGFNTIILVVPWVGFQTSVKPICYSESYFQLLTHIFSVAQETGLKVILRIGYTHEIGEHSLPDHHSRIVRLLTDPDMLVAWQDYLVRLNQIASRFDNFLFGFLTWEDFFLVNLTYPKKEVRKKLSNIIGFDKFIAKYPIKLISEWYQDDFKNHTQVPIPSYDSPTIFLFHEFWDEYLLKLHKKSKEKFPNLSLEVRVDCDPNSVNHNYICHEDTFDVGNESDKTIIYFSPAWGAENNGNTDSAEDVLNRFNYMLDKVREDTDNLIFIDQFNFIDNTPGFHKHTKIKEKDLTDFIENSYKIIDKKTIGYALWTMNDVNGNCIRNGSFERGELGWNIQKGAIIYDSQNKEKRIRLLPGGSIVQDINLRGHSNPDTKNSNLSFTLKFNSSIESKQQSKLLVKIVDSKNTIILEKEITVDQKEIELTTFPDLPLFIKAHLKVQNLTSNVIIDNIELYFRAQENGIYTVDGEPKPFRDAVVRLNKKLLSQEAPLPYYKKSKLLSNNIQGIYRDGWVGKELTGVLKKPIGNIERNFIIEAYVPDSWKGYKNTANLFLYGKKIGFFKLVPGYNKREFLIKADDNDKYKNIPFKIVSDVIFTAKNFECSNIDKRKLGFVLLGIGFSD
jgi:hypothetical protein